MRYSARIGSRLARLVGILVGIAILGIAARRAAGQAWKNAPPRGRPTPPTSSGGHDLLILRDGSKLTGVTSVAASLLAALLAAPPPSPAPAEPPLALVLGVAQDGGVPHAGCHQALCEKARRDPAARRLVASLGLLDAEAGKRFLIDATPDFAQQMERLGGLPDGILLTHAHIGHYLGLAQLGREVLGARKVPVYATPSMARFLRENGPWKRLVALENIELREIEIGKPVELTPSMRATAIQVPHRDEDSDTVAWLVEGPSRKILWLPDIDKWEKWD
ncbi:MAG: MBL fold metallo-hydrolase, partial [Thermoanaerobaculia bacterium]